MDTPVDLRRPDKEAAIVLKQMCKVSVMLLRRGVNTADRNEPQINAATLSGPAVPDTPTPPLDVPGYTSEDNQIFVPEQLSSRTL